MRKGLFVVVSLSVLVVLVVPSTGEIISQAGVRPANFATWNLEVNLTPWGYIEFTQIPFVPVDAGDSGGGDQSGAPTEKPSGIETLRQLLQQKGLLHPKVPCKTDWDCKKLDRIVKLDQNKCYDQVRTFQGNEPIFKVIGRRGETTYDFSLLSILAGKRYTKYLQTGYKIEHKCGSDGFCEVSKVDPYAPGTYVVCEYACLVDPVKYNGQIIQNTCICPTAWDGRDTPHCDYSIGNDVYYTYIQLNCKKTIKAWMICGTGGRCANGPEGIGCYPIEGSELYGSNSSKGSVQYALTMPQGMEGPIYVVAIQNGKVIAKQPISDLSAEEYITKYGPVDAGRAYEFAQKTGLTAIVERNKSISNYKAIEVYHSILW